MTSTLWVSLGVFAGTSLSFALAKKRDFRTGLSVGIGAAFLLLSILQRIF